MTFSYSQCPEHRPSVISRSSRLLGSPLFDSHPHVVLADPSGRIRVPRAQAMSAPTAGIEEVLRPGRLVVGAPSFPTLPGRAKHLPSSCYNSARPRDSCHLRIRRGADNARRSSALRGASVSLSSSIFDKRGVVAVGISVRPAAADAGEPVTFDRAVTGQVPDGTRAGMDCADCRIDRKLDRLPTCEERRHSDEGVTFPAKRPGPAASAQVHRQE